MLARIFVDKMEHFFLKRRLDEDDFENYFEALFPPVNEGVDKVASTFSEFLIPIVNQQVKRKNKQKKIISKQISLALKKFLARWQCYLVS